MFTEKKIYIYAILLLILNGINTSVDGVININPLKVLTILISYPLYLTIVVTIGAVSFYLLRQRDVYLPFLGDTVIPTSLLKNQTPSKATVSEVVNVTPNTKVLYWASETSKNKDQLVHAKEAYGDYKNMGVATSDSKGNATLKVRQPQSYHVTKMFRKKILTPHIHYRYVKSSGMLSRIETVQIKD